MKLIRKYRFVLITGVIALAVGWWLGIYNNRLKTAEAPNKIVSLELAWSTERANTILQSWSAEQRADAITSIYIDYLYIICYTLFFVTCIFTQRQTAKLTYIARVFVIMAVAAGILDVWENVFMTLYIKEPTFIKPMMFALPATVKFISLIVVLVYIIRNILRPLSQFLRNFSTVCWDNRIVVIVLVMLFALMKMDQGQDLLVNLNADKLGPITFYSIITILAVQHWFLPKYYPLKLGTSDVKHFFSMSLRDKDVVQEQRSDEKLITFHVYIPRLLGAITFILPAVSILSALQVFEIPYELDFIPPSWLFLIIAGAYIVVLEKRMIESWLGRYPRRVIERIMLISAVATMTIVGVMGLFNDGSPAYLTRLSLGLFLMSITFLIVTTGRMLPGTDDAQTTETRMQQVNVIYFVFFPGLAAMLFFVAINIFPFALSLGEGARYMTLPFVLTGLVFYVMLFSFLLVLGRQIRVQLVTLTLLFAFIMASVIENNFHDVRLLSSSVKPSVSLDLAMEQWLTDRRDSITRYSPDHPYPVFIVNTYGGGIRAAAWTGMVVSWLDEMTEKDTLVDDDFQSHVLAFSGASGGTVGASVVCAFRKAGVPVTVDSVKAFYQQDFLSPVLTGLIGRDVLFSAMGMGSVKDRGTLQEEIWENMVNAGGSDYYSKSFDSLWYDGSIDTRIPFLFSNTYYVEEGLKAIYAPFVLSKADFPSALLIRDSLCAMTRLSTGAFLSARFPLISPAGKIPFDTLKFHFMDGGLKENSGAETALQLVRVFERVLGRLQAADTVFNNVKVYIVTLNNAGRGEPPKPAKNLFQLSTPVLALYSNWLGNTDEAQYVLQEQTGRDRLFEFRPLADTAFGYKPVLPLGWQISNASLQRMHNGLCAEENQEKAQKIMELLRKP